MILFPMEFEAEKIWKKIQGTTKTENGFLTKSGTWGGKTVFSARIGMGHPGLTEKLVPLLQAHPCRAVLLAGLAGALDPAWDEGDLTSFEAARMFVRGNGIRPMRLSIPARRNWLWDEKRDAGSSRWSGTMWRMPAESSEFR
ncbi:MAG: hypothetical protein EBT69_00040 [Verrucomicrobia bacterium]|nr:hypothetical protein [Verrucomicrobiota bacterium]